MITGNGNGNGKGNGGSLGTLTSGSSSQGKGTGEGNGNGGSLAGLTNGSSANGDANGGANGGSAGLANGTSASSMGMWAILIPAIAILGFAGLSAAHILPMPAFGAWGQAQAMSSGNLRGVHYSANANQQGSADVLSQFFANAAHFLHG